MDEIRRGRTTVIIAHCFVTFHKANRIVALEEGRIVGPGLTRGADREQPN